MKNVPPGLILLGFGAALILWAVAKVLFFAAVAAVVVGFLFGALRKTQRRH